MHTYLGAIGLKNITNITQEKILIDNIIKKPTHKKLVENPYDSEHVYAELSSEFIPGIGLKIIGQYDEADKFHMESYYPYVYGRYISVSEDCYIAKKLDNTEYSGLCEDYRVGVSLIFHYIDTVDQIGKLEGNQSRGKMDVRLSALSTKGVIILPTVHTNCNSDMIDEGMVNLQMVAEAKNGNSEAIERLAMEELDTFSQIDKRIENEDLLSIVETSLIPYGMDSEVYKILGVIQEVEFLTNPIFHEKIARLKIKCNGITFDVVINCMDLQGEPEVGRRFRGIIWLQGIAKE